MYVRNLNPDPYFQQLTNTYIYGVTITPKVFSDWEKVYNGLYEKKNAKQLIPPRDVNGITDL